jgi:hypothetical protein
LYRLKKEPGISFLSVNAANRNDVTPASKAKLQYLSRNRLRWKAEVLVKKVIGSIKVFIGIY